MNSWFLLGEWIQRVSDPEMSEQGQKKITKTLNFDSFNGQCCPFCHQNTVAIIIWTLIFLFTIGIIYYLIFFDKNQWEKISPKKSDKSKWNWIGTRKVFYYWRMKSRESKSNPWLKKNLKSKGFRFFCSLNFFFGTE